MTDTIDRELPFDGPIIAGTYAPEKKRDVEMPAPDIEYKRNHDDVFYRPLSYVDNLYVLPFDHIPFWVSVTADESYDLKPSDLIRVEWTAQDDSRKYVSDRQEVRCIEQPLRFLLPEIEVRKFEGVLSDVRCVRERRNAPDAPSSSKGVLAAQLFKSSGNNIVEGVVDGVLDAKAYPNGLKVTTLTVSNPAPRSHMVVQWRHSNQLQNQQIIDADLSESTYTFIIAPEFYQAASGTEITAQFGVLQGSDSFDFWHGIGAVRFKLK